MLPRQIERKIRQAAEQYPVITLTGPRQSGKTTLIRSMFPDMQYFSLEDPELRSLASEDPRGFLAQFRKKVSSLMKFNGHQISFLIFRPMWMRWTDRGSLSSPVPRISF